MSGMTLGGWVGADRRMREFEGRVRRERRRVARRVVEVEEVDDEGVAGKKEGG
jgi:hypothetical protein